MEAEDGRDRRQAVSVYTELLKLHSKVRMRCDMEDVPVNATLYVDPYLWRELVSCMGPDAISLDLQTNVVRCLGIFEVIVIYEAPEYRVSDRPSAEELNDEMSVKIDTTWCLYARIQRRNLRYEYIESELTAQQYL